MSDLQNVLVDEADFLLSFVAESDDALVNIREILVNAQGDESEVELLTMFQQLLISIRDQTVVNTNIHNVVVRLGPNYFDEILGRIIANITDPAAFQAFLQQDTNYFAQIAGNIEIARQAAIVMEDIEGDDVVALEYYYTDPLNGELNVVAGHSCSSYFGA